MPTPDPALKGLPPGAHPSDPPATAPGGQGHPAAGPQDPGTYSWGRILPHAVSQFVKHAPDVIYGPAFGAPGALYHYGAQVVGAEPSTPQSRLGVSAMRSMVGLPPDPHAVDDAMTAAHGVNNYLANRFGSQAALKRTMYGDPAGAVGDVLAGATALEGGAGALSRVAPEWAAGPLARVSRTAGYVANPAKGVVRATRGPPPVTAGQLHPRVIQSFEAAAPGSSKELGLNPDGTPVNGPFRNRAIAIQSQKGISPQTAREAILSHQNPGAPVSGGAVTGFRPPNDRAAAVSDAAAAGHQNAATATIKDAGLDAPHLLTDPTTGTPRTNSEIRDYASRPGTPLSPGADEIYGQQGASDLRLATHADDILKQPQISGAAPQGGWLGPTVRGALAGGIGLGGAMLGAKLGHIAPNLWELGASTLGAAASERGFVEPFLKGRMNVRGADAAVTAAGAGAPQPPRWADPMATGPFRFAAPGPWALAGTPQRMQEADKRTAQGLQPPPPNPHEAINPPADQSTDPDYASMPIPDDDPHAGAAPAAAAPAADPGALAPEPKGAAPPPPPTAAAKPRKGGAKFDDTDPNADYGSMPIPDDDPGPHAAGGRVSFADGGHVAGLVDRLMSRAEREGKATRSATKPLLGLDDTTVAKALAIANRAI